MFNITEVFGHSQSGFSNTHSGSWTFIHLSKDKCSVLDYTGFTHFSI